MLFRSHIFGCGELSLPLPFLWSLLCLLAFVLVKEGSSSLFAQTADEEIAQCMETKRQISSSPLPCHTHDRVRVTLPGRREGERGRRQREENTRVNANFGGKIFPAETLVTS